MSNAVMRTTCSVEFVDMKPSGVHLVSVNLLMPGLLGRTEAASNAAGAISFAGGVAVPKEVWVTASDMATTVSIAANSARVLRLRSKPVLTIGHFFVPNESLDNCGAVPRGCKDGKRTEEQYVGFCLKSQHFDK